MPDVEDTDAADEVEIAAALRVPEFAALCPLDRNRVGGDDASWDVAVAGFQDVSAATRDGLHDQSPLARSARIRSRADRE